MKKLLFLLMPLFIQAQVNTDSLSVDSLQAEILEIELKDGSVLIGKIVSEESDFIIFETGSGIKSQIPKAEIIKQRVITDKLIEGKIWDSDPNKTRLFFAPTGRALDKGEGYFAIYELFFPFIAVGITDNFTLSGGMSLFPGADEQLLYIAPKYTFLKGKNVNLSAGVLYMRLPEVSDGAGIAYGVGTFGTSDKAFTFGAGLAFAGDEIADKPVLTFGGEYRTAQFLKLLSENWVIPGEGALFSFGLRFFGKKLAGDFGFMIPTEEDVFIPWLGFAYNF